MMKKRLAAALAVTMMAGMLSTTAFAAGDTEVKVKVTTAAPDQMSVTVPTTLAIAVIGGGSNASVAPEVRLGKDFNTEGQLLEGNETAGVGTLTFSNASKTGEGADMSVDIKSATVKNNSGSKWTLVDPTTNPLGLVAGDKWKMALSLNDKAAVATPGNDSAALEFSNLSIAGGKDKTVTVKAQAGGNSTLYSAADEGINKAYVVEWTISKTATN